MLKKLNNKKGFTLMEMLIVVAIIAVLVAVAIPTFTTALNKAKAGTDLANIRSGYAAAQLEAITKTRTADETLYLHPDGSVDDKNSNLYTTKEDSKYADTSATIGGKFSLSGSGANAVSWGKGKTISYVIDANGAVKSIIPSK